MKKVRIDLGNLITTYTPDWITIGIFFGDDQVELGLAVSKVCHALEVLYPARFGRPRTEATDDWGRDPDEMKSILRTHAGIEVDSWDEE